MWSLIYVPVLVMVALHDGPHRSTGFGPFVDLVFPYIILAIPGLLIGHSILTRWSKGDD